jgi:glutathione S-transferase
MLELDVVGKELTVVEKTFPELKKKSYLAINPMATSPSFQDGDDVIMWESGAVLDFLLERYVLQSD